jgi:lipopolysaccharide transport system ATP-binding protein
MADQPVISALGLGKTYRIWESPAARLSTAWWHGLGKRLPLGAGFRHWTDGRAEQGFRDFHALRKVDLEVRRGESVGIIGRNGSGKSTLLQMIAGTLQPSAGEVNVTGRVAAQLELGAGFNPEFTGRENVFLYGAVLGLDKAAMAAKFDEVASFADIGEFMEEPIKTYSSGMMMRLAFAVSTCVEPEILIIDEALSVGDAPFQAKCFRRLRQLIEGGVSLLFVSHDLATVKSICSRALWLKDGEIAGWGAAKDVAREYEKFCWREQGIPIDEDGEPEGGSVQQAILGDLGEKQAAQPATAPADKIQQALLQQADDFAQRAEDAGRIGTGVVQFASVVLTDTEQRLIQRVSFAQEAVWEALIVATQDISSDVVLGVAIFNVKGERIAGVQNVHHNLRLDLKAGQSIRASVRMGFPFTHEKYAARFTLLGYQNGERLVNEVYDFNRSIILDQVTDAVFFEVELHRDFPIGPAVCLPSEITLGESR